MAEKDTSNLDFWAGHYQVFCQIARELREFEAYEIINDLRYRRFQFGAFDTTTETTEPDMDVYRKCFRITFIGYPSAPEKHKFIDAAFPNVRRFQVGNSSGDASHIDEAYYYYHEESDETAGKLKKYRFAIINTPSLSENEQMTDMGNFDTDAVVFVISGNTINESEKRCLNKIKYQVDNDFLLFMYAAENRNYYYNLKNRNDIAEILSVKETEIHKRYFSSSESSCIGQHFVDNCKQCSRLLFQKIRDYMIQCYNRFETNVDAYLSSGTELIESNKELERIEDETLKEVDRINSRFRRKLDRAFPIESSYSFDIRYEMKEMTRQLSTRTLKPEEVFSQLDKSIRKLLRKWTRDLDDIIAEYLRYIKHEARERLHESGRTYRSSIPSNRNTELQAMPNFQSEFLQTYFLQTRWFPDYGRLIPSGIFPAYFAYTLMAAGATTPAAAAVFVLPAVAISLVIIGVLCWHNYEVRQKERGQQANVEGEKDMKIFNYYIAHTIRIEFEEIIFCSQDALRNIFKEIRKAERKRITIDNACPAIKAITEDSLLEKIRENRKAIESFSRW